MHRVPNALTTFLAPALLAIGMTAAPGMAPAKTFDVPCDVATLNQLVEVAGFNGEEDVLWLAPSCVYPLTQILVAYVDDGFPITIQGRAATLSGQDQRTAFIVNPGATLYLENVTVTQGSAGNPPTGDGGAIFNAGGALILTRSTVSDSRAVHGAGILNSPDSSTTLIESTLSGNTASQDGGGVWNQQGARVTLIGSTVSGNSALGQNGLGAGIYNDDDFGNDPRRAIAALTNSTFARNASRFGAGVYNEEGLVSVSHCTFTANTMLGGGNGGGIYQQNHVGGVLRLGNSILANSIAEVGGGYDCVRDPFLPERPITPVGGNLIADGSCEVVGALEADPKLGAPAGQPVYYPLLPGSPAIDLGQNPTCPGFDQRGAARPVDGNADGFAICDLGAHEAP